MKNLSNKVKIYKVQNYEIFELKNNTIRGFTSVEPFRWLTDHFQIEN